MFCADSIDHLRRRRLQSSRRFSRISAVNPGKKSNRRLQPSPVGQTETGFGRATRSEEGWKATRACLPACLGPLRHDVRIYDRGYQFISQHSSYRVDILSTENFGYSDSGYSDNWLQ